MASAQDTQLLMLGDSITESLRGDCTRAECTTELVRTPHRRAALGLRSPAQPAYRRLTLAPCSPYRQPAVWAASFAPRNALALGVSGDRTENLLYRIAHGELAGLQPALTVVEARVSRVASTHIPSVASLPIIIPSSHLFFRLKQIGTNNLAFGHSAEATAYGVQAVVRSVREALPKTHVAVMLIFPRAKDVKVDAAPWAAVDVVNELLWEALRGFPRVSVVDCTRPFIKDGAIDLSLLPDGLHPNGKGAEAWAKCLKRQMNRYLPKAKGM